MTTVYRYHLENHTTSLRSWKCTPFGAFGTTFPPEGELVRWTKHSHAFLNLIASVVRGALPRNLFCSLSNGSCQKNSNRKPALRQPSGIATIYTSRRFYIFMRRTTISHFSFLISHSSEAFKRNQGTPCFTTFPYDFSLSPHTCADQPECGYRKHLPTPSDRQQDPCCSLLAGYVHRFQKASPASFSAAS